MTKFRMSVLILAVLTALILTGCGNNATQDSSVPEALQTFGLPVNPSAAPSSGDSLPDIPQQPDNDPSGDPVPDGEFSQGNSPVDPDVTPAPTDTPEKPSNTPRPSKPTPEPDDGQPVIPPPDAASTATPDQVRDFIGKPLKDLISALGYPISSDYEPIDENDPSAGAYGTLYFDGFIATTKQTKDGEIVTGVYEDGEVPPSPTSGPHPTEEPEPSQEPEPSEDPGETP